MRMVDRIFGWLMVAMALNQGYLAFHTVYWDRNYIILSLGTAMDVLLLAAINLVRAERRHDLVLARLCVAGNALWGALTAAFILLNRAFYPLLLSELTITVVLLGLSMRSRNRSRPM